MPNFTADLATNLVAVPQVKNKSTKQSGRIRFFESTYTAPASGAPIIADTIEWGRLPVGARIIPHLSRFDWSTGTASCTINLGDSASAARHLAATAITTAGTVALTTPASGAASFETSDASNTATDNTKLVSTVAGAAIAVNQVITLRLAYVQD
jgi:hypothetical protein